jgi:intermembrane space import and assembly protein 40
MSTIDKQDKDIVMYMDEEDTSATSQEIDTHQDQGTSEAYNEETGEINWDCPCLGGMAKGSCGEEFKAAFSCFVKSETEPKGMDCIEAFKVMQDCFKEHPDEYPDDEEEEGEGEEENKEVITENTSNVSNEVPEESVPRKEISL